MSRKSVFREPFVCYLKHFIDHIFPFVQKPLKELLRDKFVISDNCNRTAIKLLEQSLKQDCVKSSQNCIVNRSSFNVVEELNLTCV